MTSYSPNNVYLYVAAYAGAISGFCGSGRQPADLDSDVYDSLCALAGAWAQEYDTYFFENTQLPYDVLTITATQTLSEESFAGRSSSGSVNPTVFTSLAGGITAILTAAEAFFAAQGIDIPAWPPGAGGVSWSNDLAGSTDTDQIVGQSSGSATGLFPIFGPPFEGGSVYAAVGAVPGSETPQSALYLFAPPGGVEIESNNWSVQSDGTNLSINTPGVGSIQLFEQDTEDLTLLSSISTGGFLVGPPLGGLASGRALQESDSLVTMTATGTTELTGAQQQSPSITVQAVTIGDAGAHLSFGNLSAAPGTSGIYLELDLSNVVTNGNTLTLVNGTASVNVTAILAYNTFFRVKLQTNTIEIDPSPELVHLNSVTWAGDLAGSTNESQQVVSLSGAPLIPVISGGLTVAALGTESGGVGNGVLYIFPNDAGPIIPDATNWSVACDGGNLYLNAPSLGSVGELVVGNDGGTTGTLLVAQPAGGAFAIAGALVGIGTPVLLSDAYATLISGETVVLTSSQQASPSLTINPITLTGAAVLDFGAPSTGIGAAFYDLDMSGVVTDGHALTLKNGTATFEIDEFFDGVQPQNLLFRVKIVNNLLAGTTLLVSGGLT